ncbi:hypothetical protein EMIHUDRAFT_461939 [Emiliania huxleyi CCMP1516]|uniref:TLC domain-containing protein n=4 Tax=Emiliania huxleyi TaxID=2903 RepID=A0A0D3I1U7_EMIH1|nr:hypothetical protein EMIHUDRAFT_461939 [Emiliania huxleyi CCMP1516]EOD05232.1 hypothetical protein EMIHUDRAFT_461939 [Emiliania huxleyi CCMP1516]|eukprot:XP_005757661.1 hypothetical protein EMIHUDRAFT_461939 [Emiliania huxleyi CCMP1516]
MYMLLAELEEALFIPLAATPLAQAVGLTPLALAAGVSCLAAQLLLFVAFSYLLPDGPWRRLPGLTAHQCICFPLMIGLACVGVQDWFLSAAVPTSLSGRVLDEHRLGGQLAQLVYGELLLWDIPCGLLVPSLREPLMLAHHFGMAAVAYATLSPLCSYYAVFFFGAIEVSGIPLSIVDVFHPKHEKHVRRGGGWFEYEKASPLCRAVNELARVCFAAAYLPLRAVYFPWVVGSQAVPDMLATLALPQEERPAAPDAALYGVIGFGIAFSALQMYWGKLVFTQVLHVLAGPKPKGE